jgi:hypothetical protein
VESQSCKRTHAQRILLVMSNENPLQLTFWQRCKWVSMGSLLAIRERRGGETQSIHLAQVVYRVPRQLAEWCEQGKRVMVGVRMFEEEGTRYALSTILAGKEADTQAQSSSGSATPVDWKKIKVRQRAGANNATNRAGETPVGSSDKMRGAPQPMPARQNREADAHGAAGNDTTAGAQQTNHSVAAAAAASPQLAAAQAAMARMATAESATQQPESHRLRDHLNLHPGSAGPATELATASTSASTKQGSAGGGAQEKLSRTEASVVDPPLVVDAVQVCCL